MTRMVQCKMCDLEILEMYIEEHYFIVHDFDLNRDENKKMKYCSYCHLKILDINDTIEYEDGLCHLKCHDYNTWLGEYYQKLEKDKK